MARVSVGWAKAPAWVLGGKRVGLDEPVHQRALSRGRGGHRGRGSCAARTCPRGESWGAYLDIRAPDREEPGRGLGADRGGGAAACPTRCPSLVEREAALIWESGGRYWWIDDEGPSWEPRTALGRCRCSTISAALR